MNNKVDFNLKRIFVTDKLNEKIKEISTIIPSDIFNVKDWYFAGGCIYSLWNGKEPKDYDIFPKNIEAVKKIRNYFCKLENKNKVNCITKNAITIGNFQFIIKYIGKPENEVIKFDFKHNMFFYDLEKGLVNLVEWDYINTNDLYFNSERARDILNIMTRIPKFTDRGMKISQNEMLKILEKGTKPSKIFSERKTIKGRIKTGRRSVYE